MPRNVDQVHCEALLVQGVIAKTVAADARRRLKAPVDANIAGSDRLRQKGPDVRAGACEVAVSGLGLGDFVGGSVLVPHLVPTDTEDAASWQYGAATDSRPVDERAVGRLKIRHHRVVTVRHDP